MPIKKQVPTGWLMIGTGVVFLAIGIFVFLHPWHAYYRLAKYTGILLLLDAALLLYVAVKRTRNDRERNWILAEVIVDLLFVLLFLFNALLSFLALPLFIGSWMGIIGGLKIAASLFLRKDIRGWGFILVEGLISLLFYGWVIYVPAPRAVSITVPIGLFAVLMGFFNIIEAIRFRKMENTLDMML
jgi:uncharacterized membrane protein HdeD (DUF308 family)